MAPTDQEIAEIYQRYAPVIFHRARSIMGSDEAAHDAVQETFARVIQRWDSFRGDASPLTWMYRITTNWCLNQIRNRSGRDRKHTVQRLDIIPEEACWQRPALEAAQVRTLLASCDEQTRRIILHIYFDDMTREETAQLVGLSVPTVRKRLNAFLRQARRKLSTSPAGLVLLIVLAGLAASPWVASLTLFVHGIQPSAQWEPA